MFMTNEFLWIYLFLPPFVAQAETLCRAIELGFLMDSILL